KNYIETVRSYYGVFWKRGINCDVIGPHDDLSSYKIVVAPMQYVADAETINNFARFVERGGALYATYTLGMVDENDLCHLGGFPGGKLREVFGIWNEEIDTLYPQDQNFCEFKGEKHKLVDYCELIHAEGAEVLAVYGDDFYRGMPVVTSNAYGAGRAYYQAARDCGTLSDAVISGIIKERGVRTATGTVDPLGYGVSAHVREDGGDRYVFVENYSDVPVTVPLGRKMTDLISDNETDVSSLDAYGLGIFKYSEE
ncbi:MAG: beta-galactosidase trimerization domain-containing protein, partial [Clostridia bacterium]|nr:beta-galactosidase trimerization domain-containing protein [Clostridia bacterium]